MNEDGHKLRLSVQELTLDGGGEGRLELGGRGGAPRRSAHRAPLQHGSFHVETYEEAHRVFFIKNVRPLSSLCLKGTGTRDFDDLAVVWFDRPEFEQLL